MSNEQNERSNDLALYLLCLGVLMIVLDTTIVTVALPSIVVDLHLSNASSTWIVNAYTLTFAGFLLLGGKLGDLYGRRRFFLIGLSVFTLASLVGGIANTLMLLLAARAVQGIGGAVVVAVSLSLIMSLFSNPPDRAKAMGVYGLTCAAGGGVGELLGGFLTKILNWHWIFLVNLPIGSLVCAFGIIVLPRESPFIGPRQLDVSGAALITAALTVAVYGLINGPETGWISAQTESLLGIVALLMLVFFAVEIRAPEPLIPLRLLRLRNFTMANIIAALQVAGMSAWYVISALYLQRVLGYDPLQVGVAFLPSELIMAVLSAGLSAKMAERFGILRPLWVGLLINAAGLTLFSRSPLNGSFLVDVLPGMLLVGVGGGIAAAPMLLAAMDDIKSGDLGVASGIVNTSFMMGGTLGLAALASLAEARRLEFSQSGAATVVALNAGYHFAFLLGALSIVSAAILARLAFRHGLNATHSISVSISDEPKATSNVAERAGNIPR